MKPLTKEQQQALLRVFKRGSSGDSYLAFRRTVKRASYDDCIMVPWCNMWLGIETDGYTHS